MGTGKADKGTAGILDRMRTLCSRREYCTEDIRKKVVRALSDDGSRDAVDLIVEELKKDGYLDDSRYSEAFARDKASISGWGTAKIRYALAAKRIDREVIEAALKEIDAAKASEKLEKVLKTKYASVKHDPAWRTRLLRFALGRGYGYDETMAVLSTLHPSS